MEYKFKGTPAPWKVAEGCSQQDRRGIDSTGSGITIIVWGDCDDEDDQCGIHGHTEQEAAANARLIAAAPDLLEAVFLAHKHFSREFQNELDENAWLKEAGMTTHEPVPPAVLVILEMAINKAI